MSVAVFVFIVNLGNGGSDSGFNVTFTPSSDTKLIASFVPALFCTCDMLQLLLLLLILVLLVVPPPPPLPLLLLLLLLMLLVALKLDIFCNVLDVESTLIFSFGIASCAA